MYNYIIPRNQRQDQGCAAMINKIQVLNLFSHGTFIEFNIKGRQCLFFLLDADYNVDNLKKLKLKREFNVHTMTKIAIGTVGVVAMTVGGAAFFKNKHQSNQKNANLTNAMTATHSSVKTPIIQSLEIDCEQLHIIDIRTDVKIGAGLNGIVYGTNDSTRVVKTPVSASEMFITYHTQGYGVVKVFGSIHQDPKNCMNMVLEKLDTFDEEMFYQKCNMESIHSLIRIFEGLHAKGIYHGDTKAENCGILENGQVVVFDFGSSDFFDRTLIPPDFPVHADTWTEYSDYIGELHIRRPFTQEYLEQLVIVIQTQDELSFRQMGVPWLVHIWLRKLDPTKDTNVQANECIEAWKEKDKTVMVDIVNVIRMISNILTRDSRENYPIFAHGFPTRTCKPAIITEVEKINSIMSSAVNNIREQNLKSLIDNLCSIYNDIYDRVEYRKYDQAIFARWMSVIGNFNKTQ